MPFPYIWLFVVQQIRTCSFSIKFENNKKTQIFAFKFLIKTILSPIFCTCRKLQVFSFPFTKKICHQNFGGLKNYHSIKAMLAKRVIFLFLTERNAWGIPHVSGMQHILPTSISCVSYVSSHPILPAKYYTDCVLFKSNLFQIALVSLGIHPQNGQRNNVTHEPPCFHTKRFGVPITVKSSITSIGVRGVFCQGGR